MPGSIIRFTSTTYIQLSLVFSQRGKLILPLLLFSRFLLWYWKCYKTTRASFATYKLTALIMTINVYGRAVTQKQWWYDTSPLVGPSLLTLNKGVRTAAVFYTLIFSVAPSESEAWIQMEMRAGPFEWGSNTAVWEKKSDDWEGGWGWDDKGLWNICIVPPAWLWARTGQGPDPQQGVGTLSQYFGCVTNDITHLTGINKSTAQRAQQNGAGQCFRKIWLQEQF